MNAEQIQALLNGATKGPWAVTSSGNVFSQARRYNRWICHGPNAGGMIAPSDGESDANARLIAAAPDLAQAALTAMAERDALQARVKALEAAIGEVASQDMADEIPEGYGSDMSESPEFHRGYDAAIGLARALLKGSQDA